MAQDSTIYIISRCVTDRDVLSDILASEDLSLKYYEDAGIFLESADASAPGCALIYFLPSDVDADSRRELLALKGRMPTIVIASQTNVSLAVQAMKDGAFDFLQKPFGRESLLVSVRAALAKSRMRHEHASRTAPLRERLERLTRREIEVIDAVLKGAPNKSVGAQLGISARTVETHRANAMAKLEARTLADLVKIWIDLDVSSLLQKAGHTDV